MYKIGEVLKLKEEAITTTLDKILLIKNGVFKVSSRFKSTNWRDFIDNRFVVKAIYHEEGKFKYCCSFVSGTSKKEELLLINLDFLEPLEPFEPLHTKLIENLSEILKITERK